MGEGLHPIGRIAGTDEILAVNGGGALAMRRGLGQRTGVTLPVGDVVLQQDLVVVVGPRHIAIEAVQNP